MGATDVTMNKTMNGDDYKTALYSLREVRVDHLSIFTYVYLSHLLRERKTLLRSTKFFPSVA